MSIDVGEKVGARSLRRMLVASSADTISVGLQSSEAFGQHESLTSRLKHILQLYPDGPGILNELIQNADDAGASKVAILLNMQQYGDRSLLGPRMSEWQGPALYFYNNSVFSQRDYINLSKIGQDSKIEKTMSTGRFGLGFNAVAMHARAYTCTHARTHAHAHMRSCTPVHMHTRTRARAHAHRCTISQTCRRL